LNSLATAAVAFGVAAAINTASVAVEQRRGCLTRWFGQYAWEAHLVLVVPPWLLFLTRLPGAGSGTRSRLPHAVRPVGWAVWIAGAWLWVQAYGQLGAARTANADIFGRVPRLQLAGGVLGWLRDPMYDAYALGLIGTALASRNPAYLLLAVESVVLLNGLESAVERRELGWDILHVPRL
jgi:protein-S-isoprenylcysteine O-methyltransferase Ste14